MAQTNIYTPTPGTPERTAIMNAARTAAQTNERFNVGHLVVLEDGTKASAIAEITAASRTVEIGGLFLFRRIDGRWEAVSMMGGGGGTTDCVDVEPIADEFLLEARKFGATYGVLPTWYFKLADEARNAEPGASCSIAERFSGGRRIRYSESYTPKANGLPPLHFVDGTNPPDAWLALRTEPGGLGNQIARLANGTLLEVLSRRSDGWWRVRAIEFGLEGWVLNRDGRRTWVYCCKQVTR
jgi:hypothetical protein